MGPQAGPKSEVRGHPVDSGARRFHLPPCLLNRPDPARLHPARYKRDADFISTTPYDGGPSYNAETCMQNWAEDRRDKHYKSGE